VDELGPIAEKLASIDDPKALLESLFAYAPVAFQIYGMDGVCVVNNQAVEKLFGSAPPPGYNIFLDDNAIATGTTELIKRAFAGETVHLPPLWYDPGDLKHVKAPAHRVAIETTMFPLRDAQGAVRHVGLCLKDVTAEMELRRSMEERRDAHEELMRLEAQSREMQEASRLKSEFLANMSHELRTPLNAILGFAELIADNVVAAGSAQYNEFIGHILSSGRHLLRLINDVLDLTKVEAGRMSFRPEHVDPAGLVEEVCEILRATGRSRLIRISTRCEPSTQAFIDPARFRQVVFNYLSNALKFTGTGGHVQVRILRDLDSLRLEVEDDGIGIATNNRARLFVEFQQLEPGAAKRHGGTGLGLALTKRLVEAQGGRVGVESQLGRGSVFFAVFPMKSEAASRPAPALTSPPRVLQASLDSTAVDRVHAPRVLVVDDDFASLRLMEAALRQLGYDPIGAEDGEVGLTLAHKLKLEYIVLDLMLPGIDGFEVLEKLRQHPTQKATPVIVWTMKDLTQAESAELALHAQAVLTKGDADHCSLVDQLATVLPKQAG